MACLPAEDQEDFAELRPRDRSAAHGVYRLSDDQRAAIDASRRGPLASMRSVDGVLEAPRAPMTAGDHRGASARPILHAIRHASTERQPDPARATCCVAHLLPASQLICRAPAVVSAHRSHPAHPRACECSAIATRFSTAWLGDVRRIIHVRPHLGANHGPGREPLASAFLRYPAGARRLKRVNARLRRGWRRASKGDGPALATSWPRILRGPPSAGTSG